MRRRAATRAARHTHTRRRSDPCSCVLLDAFRASPRGHPWPSARSPRFGPNADRVRAAPQPPANAASSAELRLCRYCPAGRGSKHRLHAVQNQRWLTPSRDLCLETHQALETLPAQQLLRACTRVTSASKWTYLRHKARLPHAPADAGGCGSALTPFATTGQKKGLHPSLHIAATAVDRLPTLGFRRACASRFATRQPIPTVARAGTTPCLGAARRTYRPGMYGPGARSPRPQAVVQVIPRLGHLGWPRMRCVA